MLPAETWDNYRIVNIKSVFPNFKDQLLSKLENKLNKGYIQNLATGTSLVVQWLRLCTPNAGGLGSIPGQGARSRMQQLRPSAAKLK